MKNFFFFPLKRGGAYPQFLGKNVFQVFIEQVLLPNLWPGAYLVMDNLPAHQVEEIRNIIEEAPNKSAISFSIFS
ncbi:MAG: hypothetical protein F6K18_03520 [Okeania sp. SIO2C2]|nr:MULTISPECIES: hypothetical protein [unclassified Okeania]NEP06766.1 hypothetical protein [Okeania sp. SIO4D6]NEP46380.1 hypothetical protein [Okeania sp. SIO2H7]NEP75883.1 hypothetical protein [Okeania sp. SIO2G5]NEP85582.1 hypothetical protein [Okeania sp. SIO2C2]NEP85961.1 hypothetical protein [Okeania sp. SIO2C2]